MPERYISPSLRNNRRLPAFVGTLTGIEAAIHDRIWNAVLDRKLRPGAKLHEDMVGNAFGVSRTIVRKVFLIMEQEGIVSLPQNRGAFIATPALEEIEPLFETLRLTMSHIIRNLADRLDDESKGRLEMHFDIALDVEKSQEARVMRRLAQEYFILLADLHGNPILSKLVERITTRASMALSLYQDPLLNGRLIDDIRSINQAVLADDTEKAVDLLLQCLDRIKATIQFEKPEVEFNIGAILVPEGERIYAKARKGQRKQRRPRRISGTNGVGIEMQDKLNSFN